MINSFQPDRVHKDLTNPDYVAWKAFLSETEGWRPDRIAEYQFAEINRVIADAKQTPAYARLFAEHGVGTLRVRDGADLRRFPIVSKEDIRDDLCGFTKPGEYEYVTTGGSTGIPFGLYRSRQAFAKELASKAHQYHRVGWREGQPQIVLRGLPIADGHEYLPALNELRFSSYHLVKEHMLRYVKLAQRYRPAWLRCYPSSAQLLAGFLEDENLRLPPLRGLLCASENLYASQIELFRRVYGGRIYAHYGHYELAAIAGFCETADTYHVLPQYGFAELLDPEGNLVTRPGEIGEIVGTSFLMDGTILLRYRTNDYAIYGGDACAHCGRPHQIWTRVEGRLQDFMVTAKGRPIAMAAVNMHDDIFDTLRQFQFEQFEPGKATFKYVARGKIDDATVEAIRGRLHPKLGDDLSLTMVSVDDIPTTQRGKHRPLIQHLQLQFGDGARQSLFPADDAKCC